MFSVVFYIDYLRSDAFSNDRTIAGRVLLLCIRISCRKGLNGYQSFWILDIKHWLSFLARMDVISLRKPDKNPSTENPIYSDIICYSKVCCFRENIYLKQ